MVLSEYRNFALLGFQGKELFGITAPRKSPRLENQTVPAGQHRTLFAILTGCIRLFFLQAKTMPNNKWILFYQSFKPVIDPGGQPSSIDGCKKNWHLAWFLGQCVSTSTVNGLLLHALSVRIAGGWTRLDWIWWFFVAIKNWPEEEKADLIWQNVCVWITVSIAANSPGFLWPWFGSKILSTRCGRSSKVGRDRPWHRRRNVRVGYFLGTLRAGKAGDALPSDGLLTSLAGQRSGSFGPWF